ncbi:class IIb bacteriocin, lactobin A/cerein 7B family [Bacillus bingmayongensis]
MELNKVKFEELTKEEMEQVDGGIG